MSKNVPREPGVDVRAKYFPVTPNVTREIDDWAAQKGVRVLALIPVYWEDTPRE